MNTVKLPICYLCGLEIVDAPSEDHVVPKQMIKRKQPRARGYDYAHTIDSHEKCNNGYKPELSLRAAMVVLAGLQDKEAFVLKRSTIDPTVEVLFLNQDKFAGLTPADLELFGILQAPGEGANGVPSLDFFRGKKKTNLARDAMYIALSVIAKSSAALLIKRHALPIPSEWKVYATAYWDGSDAFELDKVIGEAIPFDDDLKAWIKAAAADAWQVIYRFGNLVVILVFDFAVRNTERFEQISKVLEGCEIHVFEGGCLNDMLTHGWRLA